MGKTIISILSWTLEALWLAAMMVDNDGLVFVELETITPMPIPKCLLILFCFFNVPRNRCNVRFQMVVKCLHTSLFSRFGCHELTRSGVVQTNKSVHNNAHIGKIKTACRFFLTNPLRTKDGTWKTNLGVQSCSPDERTPVECDYISGPISSSGDESVDLTEPIVVR